MEANDVYETLVKHVDLGPTDRLPTGGVPVPADLFLAVVARKLCDDPTCGVQLLEESRRFIDTHITDPVLAAWCRGLVYGVVGAPGRARDYTRQLRAENERLSERVEELEKELTDIRRVLEEERNRCANRAATVERGLDRADEIQQEQVMTADEAADIRRVLGEERVRGFTCPDVAIQVRCPSCGGCWYVPSQCVGDPMFDCPFCREARDE